MNSKCLNEHSAHVLDLDFYQPDENECIALQDSEACQPINLESEDRFLDQVVNLLHNIEEMKMNIEKSNEKMQQNFERNRLEISKMRKDLQLNVEKNDARVSRIESELSVLTRKFSRVYGKKI